MFYDEWRACFRKYTDNTWILQYKYVYMQLFLLHCIPIKMWARELMESTWPIPPPFFVLHLPHLFGSLNLKCECSLGYCSYVYIYFLSLSFSCDGCKVGWVQRITCVHVCVVITKPKGGFNKYRCFFFCFYCDMEIIYVNKTVYFYDYWVCSMSIVKNDEEEGKRRKKRKRSACKITLSLSHSDSEDKQQ